MFSFGSGYLNRESTPISLYCTPLILIVSVFSKHIVGKEANKKLGRNNNITKTFSSIDKKNKLKYYAMHNLCSEKKLIYTLFYNISTYIPNFKISLSFTINKC